jgi:hypothetical protein
MSGKLSLHTCLIIFLIVQHIQDRYLLTLQSAYVGHNIIYLTVMQNWRIEHANVVSLMGKCKYYYKYVFIAWLLHHNYFCCCIELNNFLFSGFWLYHSIWVPVCWYLFLKGYQCPQNARLCHHLSFPGTLESHSCCQ